jgi:hypothetical protein
MPSRADDLDPELECSDSDKPGPFDAVTHTETTAGGSVWVDAPSSDLVKAPEKPVAPAVESPAPDRVH